MQPRRLSRLRSWAPLWQGAADGALLMGLALAAASLRQALSWWIPISLSDPAWTGILFGVWTLPPAFALAGLYPGYGLPAQERLRRRVLVTALMFAVMLAYDTLAQRGLWSRGVVLITLAEALLLLPLWDPLVRRLLLRLGLWGQPVVILGPPDKAQRLVEQLRAQPLLGYLPHVAPHEGDGLASDDPQAWSASAVDAAILLPTPETPFSADWVDRSPFRHVVVLPELEGLEEQWAVARHLGLGTGLEMRRNLLLPHNRLFKRLLDLLLTLPLLLLAAPLTLLGALAVAWRSPGAPLFYAQTRRGRKGRLFKLWKLRTMIPDAEARLQAILAASPELRQEWEGAMKLRRDPRVIPGVGGFLRRFSLDELPQLWNVLRGDMSLVGPRPLPDYHLDRFPPAFARLRGETTPGVTGLWQVSGRSDTSLERQMALDGYYIRNWSLWLDGVILGRTVFTVLRGNGAY
ncbi:MAG: exopolysaccharide biosynthesis polyprenyl glycosylphosphotransferase [Magnetococcales bacterium]|nr:exopolysaccharide biosynthesis polyprenyl glycosylphosphotransferase [Magnetococcales bacterium]